MAIVLRTFGWMLVAIGTLAFLLCLLMLLNRSPQDFEGTLTGAAIMGMVVVALPTFVVGLLMVGFGNRKISKHDQTPAP